MTAKPIVFEADGPLGVVTLQHPPVNSYGIDFVQALADALDAAEAATGIHVVLVRSALPGVFSAGADIKALGCNSTADNMAMIRRAHQVFDRMTAGRQIFVAAIAGHCLGGGLELALACDLRLGAAGAYRLGLPEIRLGLHPGNGGTQRLPRVIGMGKALEMIVSGQTVGPEEGCRLGILNQLRDERDFEAQVMGFARRLAQGPPLAMAAAKRVISQGMQATLAEGLKLEVESLEALLESEDGRQGLRCYLAKETPRFAGR